ncbi:hypothetical protein PAECIP111893_05045 [Paenibacillus plantiphilus]|uniref:Uncharacterized protein n=1 Tax=Paenibacillus plantiphilus TaxID=2905650 RepID=A0ABM9CVW9_9BACL|nr:hypothetical protein PAECIP111893_05045 [Paenibacillus plantiphilus]
MAIMRSLQKRAQPIRTGRIRRNVRYAVRAAETSPRNQIGIIAGKCVQVDLANIAHGLIHVKQMTVNSGAVCAGELLFVDVLILTAFDNAE